MILLYDQIKKYIYIIDFRIAVKEEYKELSDKATKYLLPFINTEHVERKFSSYAYVKTNIEIG